MANRIESFQCAYMSVALHLGFMRPHTFVPAQRLVLIAAAGNLCIESNFEVVYLVGIFVRCCLRLWAELFCGANRFAISEPEWRRRDELKTQNE